MTSTDWIKRERLAYPQYEKAYAFYISKNSKIETMREFDMTPHQFKHMLTLADKGVYV